MVIDFTITSNITSSGRTVYSAQKNNSEEPKFIIGYRTKYENNFGLFNTQVRCI